MSDSKLSPRYEIRPLELEHLEWAKALFAYSFVFGSPIWRNLYPSDKTARFYGLYQASDYLIKYQIVSGLSLGLFDREYEFKNPESAGKGGGKLYFDLGDAGAGEADLLRQMDTPLVSIACAFDAFYAMDNRRVAPVTGRLPASASFHAALAEREAAASSSSSFSSSSSSLPSITTSSSDNDDDDDSIEGEGARWRGQRPTAPGQVLQRMGTATRADAEAQGLMKAVAHHMMRRAAAAGFRGIRIECFHDAVTAVWANPPAPFTGCVVGEVDTYMLGEADVDGRWRFPYRPVRQRLARVYVSLR